MIEVRYSEDQPRDPDGKFGSGDGSAASGAAAATLALSGSTADYPAVQAVALTTAEASILGQGHETIVIVGPDGGILLRQDGEAGSVAVSGAGQQLMSGAVVTHNHTETPAFGKETMPLSYDDILIAADNGATAVRAVSPNGVVTEMRPGPSGWGDRSKTERVMALAEDKVREHYTPLVQARRMGIQRANSMAQNGSNRAVAKAMGWTYKVFE